MRSYKSIERPAQVLGMNLQDLGLLVGLFIGSVLLLGFLGMAVKIPRLVYLLVILSEIGLLLGLRYLTRTQAPGFLMAWLSYTFIQPRRLAVGLLPPPAHGKNPQDNRV
ncbi:hypothetical protein GCM10023172_42990 [Hymenobacter ginsengisoli]|uniref:PrgI family protein n=1 Tax=Hymenobacter ginsengisoli TaxID=1051626 RepID=A0ABP8QRG6_9BACT|nr:MULTISPECIES: hypothetical protein [unclassified Hymenobacter]MBO2033453.1 hypothetical protein [Hymenobacter sp. BT559]